MASTTTASALILLLFGLLFLFLLLSSATEDVTPLLQQLGMLVIQSASHREMVPLHVIAK